MRTSNLVLDIIIIIVYIKAFYKLRLTDIRDKLLFNVSFASTILDIISLIFFNSEYILLLDRIIALLLESTMCIILAEIMYLKIQKIEDELIRSHLK